MRAMFPAVLVLALLVLAGCKVQHPGAVETDLANSAKHRIFVGNKSEQNPLKPTPATIAAGKEAFSHFCIACHGKDGQNTGVLFADRMSPPVPSLASRDVQSYSDGQLKWVIEFGISPSGMPGSNGTLNEEEIWSIVVFLRHLPPAGSEGEPEMYSH